jgi:FMN phosphatase YigB (HAD superfamily)
LGGNRESMRFLDQFSVLLLDMNGTFMFGHDRFGSDEDYYATYKRLGGRRLDHDHLVRIVNATFARLSLAYGAPACFDNFPSLSEVLLECSGVEKSDLPTLEDVFATHELGYVPPSAEKFLRETALSHDLGIVSNIWSPPARWRAAFRESGLHTVFKTVVFSSEGRSIKPSRLIFERALAMFPTDAVVLFVGDSLERDIIPAKELGLFTAWIAPAGSAAPWADVVVDNLPALAEVAA